MKQPPWNKIFDGLLDFEGDCAMSDLADRLRERAALMREWHTWELGRGEPPPPMSYWGTADLLDEAAVALTSAKSEVAS